MARSSSTSTSSPHQGNNARATSTKAVITRVEPCSKPASSTTARSATASCRSRKSPAATSSDGVDVGTRAHPGRAARRPGAHRPGREGRARQQGRGPHHLHQPRRPLPRADAEQPARRRRLAPHRGRGPRTSCAKPWTSSRSPTAWASSRAPPASAARAEELQWDLNYLLQLWTRDRQAPRKAGNGAVPDLPGVEPRHPRDPRLLPHDIGEILIDTDEIYEQAQAVHGTRHAGQRAAR